jgi:two-component system sensor histidine kinase MtrB
MSGVRGRLTITLVTLVVLTAAVLGVGAYAYASQSLRQRLVEEAAEQARFDLTVLIPTELPGAIDRAAYEESRLPDLFDGRGVRVVHDFDGLDPSFQALLLADFTAAIGRGELAYQWAAPGGQSTLIVGGRLPGAAVTFYFLHDARPIEAALSQLALGLGGGAVILTLVALVAARLVARGVLAPVEVAARAAERMEHGDLSVRVPVTSRDEFGRLARRFNRMAATLEETIGRLEASQAQNRRFVSDVAHELRTPLTALVAEASILREHLAELPPGARRTGELLVDDVARLRTLVDELMELSRFDASAEEARHEPVDLARLIRAIVAARLPSATLNTPTAPLVVATDPRRLERIVGNLLDNAREHAAGAGVEVTLTVESGDVVIAVADRGPGVPADRLARIFDRFYKADPSRHGGSSGLGLAIAAEHAALLGGELEAANRDGGGLWIWLRLPVTQPLPGGDDAANGEAEPEGHHAPAGEPTP